MVFCFIIVFFFVFIVVVFFWVFGYFYVGFGGDGWWEGLFFVFDWDVVVCCCYNFYDFLCWAIRASSMMKRRIMFIMILIRVLVLSFLF